MSESTPSLPSRVFASADRKERGTCAGIKEVLPDAMGNTSAGAAHEVLGLLSKLTEMMDSLSSEVTARVIEPINGYLSGELAEAKHQYGGFLDFQKRVEKSR